MKKTYDSKFKSRVALEALRGELTIAEIASKYQIHPNQVQRWKQRLMEGASDIFASSSERKAEQKKPYTDEVCPWRWAWISKSPDKCELRRIERQQAVGVASRAAFELLLQTARRPSQTLH